MEPKSVLFIYPDPVLGEQQEAQSTIVTLLCQIQKGARLGTMKEVAISLETLGLSKKET
jgi:hypothetical protein